MKNVLFVISKQFQIAFVTLVIENCLLTLPVDPSYGSSITHSHIKTANLLITLCLKFWGSDYQLTNCICEIEIAFFLLKSQAHELYDVCKRSHGKTKRRAVLPSTLEADGQASAFDCTVLESR